MGIALFKARVQSNAVISYFPPQTPVLLLSYTNFKLFKPCCLDHFQHLDIVGENKHPHCFFFSPHTTCTQITDMKVMGIKVMSPILCPTEE